MLEEGTKVIQGVVFFPQPPLKAMRYACGYLRNYSGKLPEPNRHVYCSLTGINLINPFLTGAAEERRGEQLNMKLGSPLDSFTDECQL